MPPVAETVALPVLLPEQSTFVCALMLAFNAAAGCVMATFVVVLQPFASLTVQL